MKRIVFFIVFLFGLGSLLALDVQKNGATLGKWTMDYDKALVKAKKEDKPIFLQFTGSDWCPWCKLMARNVFSKKVWDNYAKNEMYLVYLDFPRKNPNLVPKKYRARNQQLAQQYGIRGFPTYIILDSNGTTELGRLSAGQNKTAYSFIKEVKRLLRKRPSEMKKFLKKLPTNIAKKLKKKMANLEKKKADFDDWLATRPQKNEKNIKIYNNYLTQIDRLNHEIDEIFDNYSK